MGKFDDVSDGAYCDAGLATLTAAEQDRRARDWLARHGVPEFERPETASKAAW